MRALVYFKIAALVVLLAGVSCVIRKVNPDSTTRFLAALGIEPGTVESPGLQSGGGTRWEPGMTRMSLCPTRIHAISWLDGKEVRETREGLKSKWMVFDPRPREIGYLEMEKWLSRHCQIVVESTTKPPATQFESFMIIRYVDGSELHIKHGGTVLFLFGNQAYLSEDFRSALDEITAIAR